MAESQSHKTRKRKAAGKTGYTEHTLPSGRKVDAVTGTDIFVEIERGGVPGITRAVSRLKEAKSDGARKVRISVPQEDVEAAVREMRKQRVGGQVINLGGTDKRHVAKRQKGARL